jgi:phage shock protein A
MDELEALKQEYQHLEATLKGMKKRIDQLEKKGD